MSHVVMAIVRVTKTQRSRYAFLPQKLSVARFVLDGSGINVRSLLRPRYQAVHARRGPWADIHCFLLLGAL